MGDSRSAYYDDCENWSSLRHEAGITDVNWAMYSDEALYAEKGFREKNLVGERLKKYVARCIATKLRQQQRQEERAEYRLYLKLKKKYDK